MRGRDQTHEGSGDDRIINPESESQAYFKAVIDAEWGRGDPDADPEAE